ncbi:MAG: hypothetical protein M1495_16400 [Bacteroidetes bacterium]|nr:hypothetical protein [Bacteroidota bacterium]
MSFTQFQVFRFDLKIAKNQFIDQSKFFVLLKFGISSNPSDIEYFFVHLISSNLFFKIIYHIEVRQRSMFMISFLLFSKENENHVK